MPPVKPTCADVTNWPPDAGEKVMVEAIYIGEPFDGAATVTFPDEVSPGIFPLSQLRPLPVTQERDALRKCVRELVGWGDYDLEVIRNSGEDWGAVRTKALQLISTPAGQWKEQSN